MNYLEMFNTLESIQPIETDELEKETYQPQYQNDSMFGWEDSFNGFKTSPVLYNLDGYISPYSSENWSGTSTIMKTFDDGLHNITQPEKIDPNKIFNSDINALKALAADQKKVAKIFEKRLLEGLTDRGKIGLDESDIMAMQALTSSYNAIASISKEQINIKKNIADLKIKQSQNKANATDNGSTNNSGKSLNSVDIGRSILDGIFDLSNSEISTPSSVSNNIYQESTSENASEMIDIMTDEISPYTKYERLKPTTYVVVGDTDNDIEFATYTESGELIPDYPNPTSKITNIDRETNTAVDEFLIPYPIKSKY